MEWWSWLLISWAVLWSIIIWSEVDDVKRNQKEIINILKRSKTDANLN